jgi:hypothetical protein
MGHDADIAGAFEGILTGHRSSLSPGVPNRRAEAFTRSEAPSRWQTFRPRLSYSVDTLVPVPAILSRSSCYQR